MIKLFLRCPGAGALRFALQRGRLKTPGPVLLIPTTPPGSTGCIVVLCLDATWKLSCQAVRGDQLVAQEDHDSTGTFPIDTRRRTQSNRNGGIPAGQRPAWCFSPRVGSRDTAALMKLLSSCTGASLLHKTKRQGHHLLPARRAPLPFSPQHRRQERNGFPKSPRTSADARRRRAGTSFTPSRALC